MQISNKEALKDAAAKAALQYVVEGAVLGVGSGSTVNAFIALLAPLKDRISGAVAASSASSDALRKVGVRLFDLNDVESIPVYVDGADEIDSSFAMIKGGGAALTREKIIASASGKFICLVDSSKCVEQLGVFPLPLEVIPIAVNLIVRRLAKMGATATVRAGAATDNGNQILDVVGLSFVDAVKLETQLNQMPGVVCNGVFALRPADVLVAASSAGIDIRQRITK